MKKNVVILLIAIVIALMAFGLIIMNKTKYSQKKPNKEIHELNTNSKEFNYNLIKVVNQNQQNNYLISPYSIEIALNILRAGASGDTKAEFDKVIGIRKINNLTIKDHLSIANAAFFKNQYKEFIKNTYYKTLTDEYNSELLYDDFTTPKVINDWVNKKTNGMIDKILDDINPMFVLGLANALAIDVKWNDPFICEDTTSEKFTKIDNKNIAVEMMHKTYKSGAKYLENDYATGIIIPYKKYDAKTGEELLAEESNLEFIGILPKKDLDGYINTLTNEELLKLINSAKESSDSLNIALSLPRFTYDYELADFEAVLQTLGIKLAFDPDLADFTNIADNNTELGNLYVGEAIHKTHIELNEAGTKAAAVTYFGMYKNTAMPQITETKTIEFNRPFIYIIRDNKTNEMLFFGTIYEPNEWHGTTCS